MRRPLSIYPSVKTPVLGEVGFNQIVTHSATIFCQKRRMKPHQSPQTGDLFPQPPLTPARMDAFLRHMTQFKSIAPYPARRRDFLLESVRQLDQLYPAAIGQYEAYQPLTPMVEQMEAEQAALRAGDAVPRHMERPNLQTAIKTMANRLQLASETLRYHSRHAALHEAWEQDLAMGNSPLYAFPRVAALASAPQPPAHWNYDDALRSAYKMDWRAINTSQPSPADDPRERHCAVLDRVYCARWATAAKKLGELLENYEISMAQSGNPKKSGADKPRGR